MIEQYPLYGGAVLLVFDPEKHVYTYQDQVVDGVTTITDSVLDKSYALMPWALKMAREYLESKWPVDGLVPMGSSVWNSLMEGMRKAHYSKKRSAADVGTIAHNWIEEFIKAGMMYNPDPPKPTDAQALHAVDAFLRYVDANHVIFKASEKKVYSVKHNYAGTLDILAEVNNVENLLDVKTSNSYRKEYALQTAAYCGAYNEEHGTNVHDRIILMLPKDGTSELNPIVRTPDDYVEDIHAFTNALNLYRWAKNQGANGKRKSAKRST